MSSYGTSCLQARERPILNELGMWNIVEYLLRELNRGYSSLRCWWPPRRSPGDLRWEIHFGRSHRQSSTIEVSFYCYSLLPNPEIIKLANSRLLSCQSTTLDLHFVVPFGRPLSSPPSTHLLGNHLELVLRFHRVSTHNPSTFGFCDTLDLIKSTYHLLLTSGFALGPIHFSLSPWILPLAPPTILESLPPRVLPLVSRS